ncbi:hypothetical protein [Neobacillus niacini]|uniref:hypothetical protein n=1 Tax=Neobacillus niacini TaxID=86668 RepID=UPI0039831EC1
MNYCPFCDGQGIVHKAKIEKTNRTIYICDECDSIWLDDKEINVKKVKRFDDFMRKNNLKPLWSELTDIERDWNNGE